VLKNLRKQITKNKVLISAFNFSLMPQIIKNSGFKPIFIDVDPKTFNISKDDLIKKIDDDCGIAIVTHILGNPLDISIIMELKKRGIIVIEDCAHTFNSIFHSSDKISNKIIKTGSLGDISIFSFNFSKPLNSIYGGAIILNNLRMDDISKELEKVKKKKEKISIFKELRFYLNSLSISILFTNFIFNIFTWMLIKLSFIKRPRDIIDVFSKENPEYLPKKIKLLNKLALMILERNIKKIDRKNHLLFKIQQKYDSYLKNIIKQKVPNSARYHYAILVKNLEDTKRILINKNIDIKIQYSIDISKGECKEANNLKQHVIYLPFYQSLKEKDIKTVSNALLENNLVFFKNKEI